MSSQDNKIVTVSPSLSGTGTIVVVVTTREGIVVASDSRLNLEINGRIITIDDDVKIAEVPSTSPIVIAAVGRTTIFNQLPNNVQHDEVRNFLTFDLLQFASQVFTNLDLTLDNWSQVNGRIIGELVTRGLGNTPGELRLLVCQMSANDNILHIGTIVRRVNERGELFEPPANIFPSDLYPFGLDQKCFIEGFGNPGLVDLVLNRYPQLNTRLTEFRSRLISEVSLEEGIEFARQLVQLTIEEASLNGDNTIGGRVNLRIAGRVNNPT